MVSPVCSCTKNVFASASSITKPRTYQTAPPGAVRGPVLRSVARRFLDGGFVVSAIFRNHKYQMQNANHIRHLIFGIVIWHYRILRGDAGLDLVEHQFAGL